MALDLGAIVPHLVSVVDDMVVSCGSRGNGSGAMVSHHVGVIIKVIVSCGGRVNVSRSGSNGVTPCRYCL